QHLQTDRNGVARSARHRRGWRRTDGGSGTGNIRDNRTLAFEARFRKNKNQSPSGFGEVSCRLRKSTTGSEFVSIAFSYPLNLPAGSFKWRRSAYSICVRTALISSERIASRDVNAEPLSAQRRIYFAARSQLEGAT